MGQFLLPLAVKDFLSVSDVDSALWVTDAAALHVIEVGSAWPRLGEDGRDGRGLLVNLEALHSEAEGMRTLDGLGVLVTEGVGEANCDGRVGPRKLDAEDMNSLAYSKVCRVGAVLDNTRHIVANRVEWLFLEDACGGAARGRGGGGRPSAAD